MKRAKLTELERVEIRAAIRARAHCSAVELAKRLGIDRRIISLVTRIDPQSFFEIQEAAKLRPQLTAKVLARKYNCAPGTIHQISREAKS